MSEIRKLIVKFLKIIADQTRLEILQLINNKEKSSSEIQEHLNKSQSTISQHLKILINNGLVDFYQKEVILEMENPKKPNKISNISKTINYYLVKNKGIFEILSNIQAFVLETNKEQIKNLRDLDIYDTLL